MQKISKRADGSTRVATFNEEPTMAQQQFKDDCDINHIIKKYQQTGQITHMARKNGVYADVSKISGKTYLEALNTVLNANEAFDALPSEIRERFQNDPAELLKFMQDPKNYDEGVKIGIFEPKKSAGEPQTTNPQTTNPNPPV